MRSGWNPPPGHNPLLLHDKCYKINQFRYIIILNLNRLQILLKYFFSRYVTYTATRLVVYTGGWSTGCTVWADDDWRPVCCSRKPRTADVLAATSAVRTCVGFAGGQQPRQASAPSNWAGKTDPRLSYVSPPESIPRWCQWWNHSHMAACRMSLSKEQTQCVDMMATVSFT